MWALCGRTAPRWQFLDRQSALHVDVEPSLRQPRLAGPAVKLLAPGGPLLTISSRDGIGADLLHKIVAGAAAYARVDAAILARLEAAPDHSTTVVFPGGGCT